MAARDRRPLSAWENVAPVIAATLALGANPGSRAPQAIATGHRDVLQFLLEGDVLSAEATLRRRLRGAVEHRLSRFQAPDPWMGEGAARSRFPHRCHCCERDRR